MMSDQEINDKIASIKKAATSHKLLTILIIAAVVTMVLIVMFTRNHDLAGNYKQQIDSLRTELKVFKKQYTEDSLRSARLQFEVDSIKTDRAALVSDINKIKKNISTISNQYEKVPNYLDLSNDSLRSQFTRRFDY